MTLNQETKEKKSIGGQLENSGNHGSPVTEDETIGKIFQHIEAVAELHAVLTSPRGQYLHRRLLHSLRGVLTVLEIEEIRRDHSVEEAERHINKLAKWALIQPVRSSEGISGYERTAVGEQALNAVRELERKIGEDRARAIFEAALGVNALRLFLTIFGNNKEPDVRTREVVYTALEIGQLMRVFARSLEGISSMDKLDDGGLVSYLDDGNIHVNPRRSTAFYAYLKKLFQLLVETKSLGVT